MKDAIGNEVCVGDDVIYIAHEPPAGRFLKVAKVVKMFDTNVEILIENKQDTTVRREYPRKLVVVGSLL